MALAWSFSATGARMSSRRRRFYVRLLLIAILLTAIMSILFASGSFMESELTVRKRSSLPCNSSISSVVKFIQCASFPNECILASFVCDVTPDCSDQSDESNATCRGIPSCDEQDGETCLNNGSCVSHPRTTSRVAYHSCNCTTGYTGRYCDVLAPTTAEPSTTTFEKTEGMVTSTRDILSTATDGAQTTLSLSSVMSTSQHTSSARVTETRTPLTDGPTHRSDGITTPTPSSDIKSTTVFAPSPTTATTAITGSSNSEDFTNNVAVTSPENTVSISPSMEPSTATTSTSLITSVSETTDPRQRETLTTNAKSSGNTVTLTSSPESTSPSASTSDVEEVSATTSDQQSTSVDGFTDDLTSTTKSSTTDLSLYTSEELPSSSTISMATVPSTSLVTSRMPDSTIKQGPVPPNTVSFICNETDLIFSIVECATPNECILNIFVCDGVPDCSDGSDESPATCLGEPACEGAANDVCANGGTCSSNPVTSERVAHVTCLCSPLFTGDRCLEDAVYTTTPSSTATLQTSNLMLTTLSEVSTDIGTSATELVTRGDEDTQPTILSITTERDTTVPFVTTRDVEASTPLTSIPALQTFSDSPATEEITTEITAVMTSSSNGAYATSTESATSDVYTESTMTVGVSSSTTQYKTTATESSSDITSTHSGVTEISTYSLPLTTAYVTQTGTPMPTSPTTDRPTTTEDMVPLDTDMITDYLTTESEDFMTVSVTEVTTIFVSKIDGITTENPDITAVSDFRTELTVVTTDLPTQITSLKTSATTLTTLEPSQTITNTKGERTETMFSTMSIPDKTPELATILEQSTSTKSISTTISDSLDKSTAPTLLTAATNNRPVSSEVFTTLETATSENLHSSVDTKTTSGSYFLTSTEQYTTSYTTTDTTLAETTLTTVSPTNTITTLELKKTTQPTTESSPTDFTSGTSSYTTISTQKGSEYTKATTSEATSTQRDTSSPKYTTTQVIYSTKRTTTDHFDTSLQSTTLIPRPETTDEAKYPTTSAKKLTTSPPLSSLAVETTDTEKSSTTVEGAGDQSTPSGTTESPTTASPLFSTTNVSSTTTSNRTPSSDRVVLIVLSSTAAVILVLIVCLVIVGCCIARKWRERNSYLEDDQIPLRSLQTYSRQSNQGRKYGLNNFEIKPSFVHRLKPVQSTKLDNESDVQEDASISFPPSSTLSIINDYFEQMHGGYNDSHKSDAYSVNHQQSRKELHDDREGDLESESFEIRFFPDTEYWMPSSVSDAEDIPYYITDDAPLPVSHV